MPTTRHPTRAGPCRSAAPGLRAGPPGLAPILVLPLLVFLGGAFPPPASGQTTSAEGASGQRVSGQVHRTIRRAGPGPLPRAVHGVRLGTTTAGTAGSGIRLGAPAARPVGASPGTGSRGGGDGGGIVRGVPHGLVRGPIVRGGHPEAHAHGRVHGARFHGRIVHGPGHAVRLELLDRTIVLTPFRAFVFDAAGNRRVFLLGPTLRPFGFFPWILQAKAVHGVTLGFHGRAGARIDDDRGGGYAAPYRPPPPDLGPPLPEAAEAPPGVCAEATVRMVAGTERRLRIATGPLGAETPAEAEGILRERARRGDVLALRGPSGSGLLVPGGLVREVSVAPCAEDPAG